VSPFAVAAAPEPVFPEKTPPIARVRQPRVPAAGYAQAPGRRAQIGPSEVVEFDYGDVGAEFDPVPSSGGFDAPVTTATTVSLSPVPDAGDWDPETADATVSAPPPFELMRAIAAARAAAAPVPAVAAEPASLAVPEERAVSVSTEVAPIDDDLAAELQEVDFFMAQALDEEALSSLADLAKRYPAHPAVAAKLRQVLARAADGGGAAVQPGPVPVGEAADEEASQPIITSRRDTRSHSERALTYKEQGDYDRAIEELKHLVKDRRRAVFALTTMGECYAAKGSLTEAVIRYKKALNEDDVTDAEGLLLYYLLGEAFERLGDLDEALYFFETVAKRDPRFRAVERKLAALKPPRASRA